MFTTWNKPAGLPCFPPHADPNGDCVLKRLLAAQPDRLAHIWPDGFAAGIAHRLDVHTSGALLLANDPQALVQLRMHFSSGELRKTYRFVSAKEVRWDSNQCERPVAHDRRKKGRMVVQRGAHTPHRGKWYPASTAFQQIHGRLWKAVITTGVMHQIRVHAAFVGLPLLGDHRYGGGRSADGFRLHHVGVEGPGGLASDAVPMPIWGA
jgi:23S rRNA-/tRNA-specific pseudouridylate synthase